ncbi:unannotated protein [freshwater metagenome]|uniref:Unannotated protein n=1 Tax=freshwater metagenome TaxID=449393 RepID=A0A6J7J2J1_9ZZZZ|nr:hypothetical protein [Actinomycetota bacterium]
MIVRISGEAQYRLADDVRERVNELEAGVIAASEAGDEPGFLTALDVMLAMVRAEGEPLADDELHGSDVILPPADTTFAESRHAFTGEGLIPD